MKVQMLVTQRCNDVCDHCDKAVGLANMPDLDMTQAKMAEFVDEALEQKVFIKRMSVSGGEPIVNKELQGVINEMARLNVEDMPIYTNGMPTTREKRGEIKLPDQRFSWDVAPLNDPFDPMSGKDKHIPYWISPQDIGVESRFRKCNIKRGCGRGLDVNGWTMCGQAPILGRILGIDPYLKGGTIKDRVDTGIEEICKHCIYGTGWNMRKRREMLKDHPMTAVYKEAFARDPEVFGISLEKVS